MPAVAGRGLLVGRDCVSLCVGEGDGAGIPADRDVLASTLVVGEVEEAECAASEVFEAAVESPMYVKQPPQV